MSLTIDHLNSITQLHDFKVCNNVQNLLFETFDDKIIDDLKEWCKENSCLVMFEIRENRENCETDEKTGRVLIRKNKNILDLNIGYKDLCQDKCKFVKNYKTDLTICQINN